MRTVIPKTIRRVVIKIVGSKDDQFYFVVKAGNGEVVGVSETYKRRPDAVRAAHRFRDLVTRAVIE